MVKICDVSINKSLTLSSFAIRKIKTIWLTVHLNNSVGC